MIEIHLIKLRADVLCKKWASGTLKEIAPSFPSGFSPTTRNSNAHYLTFRRSRGRQSALAYTSIELNLYHSLTGRKQNCLFACTERQARHSGRRAPCTRWCSLLNGDSSCSTLSSQVQARHSDWRAPCTRWCSLLNGNSSYSTLSDKVTRLGTHGGVRLARAGAVS